MTLASIGRKINHQTELVMREKWKKSAEAQKEVVFKSEEL